MDGGSTGGRRVVGVDLGGTKLAIGLVDQTLAVLAQCVTPTETSSAAACLADLLARLDETLASFGAVDAIGIGTASMVDFSRGRIVVSTNLPLRDLALRDILSERYKLPVVVDNDATAACIAEHRFGAGVGTREMLMLTLGTGIGGGIICGGRPYRGFSGAGGELGHMVVDINGARCQGNCPNYGCLETVASGNAMGAAVRALAAERPDSAFGRARAAGEELDGRLLTRLALEGDGDALALVERVGTLLGVGITGLVNIFNPELVVVGGGAAAAGELLLAPARRVVETRGLQPQRDEVRVVGARFGEDAALLGAAALALVETTSISSP